MRGNCPKCGQAVGQLGFEQIMAIDGGRRYPAITFSCNNGSCKAVLGVQFSPDVMAEVTKKHLNK